MRRLENVGIKYIFKKTREFIISKRHEFRTERFTRYSSIINGEKKEQFIDSSLENLKMSTIKRMPFDLLKQNLENYSSCTNLAHHLFYKQGFIRT